MGRNNSLIKIREGRRSGWILAITVAAGVLSAPLPALSQPPADALTRTAALPPAPEETDPVLALPQPLDAIEADRYREIFRLQEKGDWRGADRLIDALTDRRLLGHVLAQRYLHPAAYRSSYRELKDWLAAYADHPDAPAIYHLALKRRPPGAEPPSEPAVSVPPVGNPDLAIEPESPHWEAGLDAWRQGRMAAAARHFEAVALADESSPWNQAAAAFWAARSHLKARQPEQVSRWLARAAEHPRTFYGQLARRALGMDPGLDWTVRPLLREEARVLFATRRGQRALALLQIGEIKRAEDEMNVLQTQADPELAEALIAVSQLAEMPTLALRLGSLLARRTGRMLDAALYPLPAWEPEGGFTVDRALLYALMRQESAFNPDAESPAGATGLMQLMPSTAGFIVGDGTRFLGPNQRDLRDPELNLTLAQKYVEHLLADPIVGGDLLLLVAAYNAGPGNVAKWRRDQEAYGDDPLLFIESIPWRETRLFVERVLTNLWIYRQRMGQETPSLEAVVAGARPVYASQDTVSEVADSNGRN